MSNFWWGFGIATTIWIFILCIYNPTVDGFTATQWKNSAENNYNQLQDTTLKLNNLINCINTTLQYNDYYGFSVYRVYDVSDIQNCTP